MNKRKHKELVHFVHQKMPENLHIYKINRPFGLRYRSLDSPVMAYMVVYLCNGITRRRRQYHPWHEHNDGLRNSFGGRKPYWAFGCLLRAIFLNTKNILHLYWVCVQRRDLLFKYVAQNVAGAIRFLNFTLRQNRLRKQNVVGGRLDFWALKWKDI